MYKAKKLCQQFFGKGKPPKAPPFPLADAQQRFLSSNGQKGGRMNKINGYTEEEATGLIEYIYSGKNARKTLSYLFETYGK